MAYNGFFNYETWACNLWLSNDEGYYRVIRNKIDELKEQENIDIVYELTEFIHDFINAEAERYTKEANLFSDFINASIEAVDYLDIAKSFLSD